MEKIFKTDRNVEITLIFKDSVARQYKSSSGQLLEIDPRLVECLIFDEGEGWQDPVTEVFRSGVSMTDIVSKKLGLTIKAYDTNCYKLSRIQRASTWKPEKDNGF